MMTTLGSVDSGIKIKKNVRWGIVGLGDVCKVKSGPPFWKCDGSELVAVMRRTQGAAADFAKTVPGGGCTGYDDFDSFLAHPGGLDAIYVSTRPGTHLEICAKVAKAGLACYVEKPVGRCAAETMEIVRVFAEAELPLYTAYISRAYDRTQMARSLLVEGAIGECIKKVTYNLVGTGGARGMDGDLPWRLNPSQSGGGLIMDVGCHVLDRIDYLAGPIINVKGVASRRNKSISCVNNGLEVIDVEDFVQINAELGEGKWAVLPCKEAAEVSCKWDFSGESPNGEIDELIFEGPSGKIVMAGMNFSAPLQVFDANGNLVKELTFTQPKHTGQQLIQAVNDDLRGIDKKDYLSNGENALRTSKVLDEALSYYYGGNRDIGYWEKKGRHCGEVS